MDKNELKDFRSKHRLNQSQLAEIANVKVGTVQSWEQGKRNIGQSAIKLLQEYESKKTRQDKTPQDVRFEDLVSDKVVAELLPIMNNMRDQVISQIKKMDIEITRMRTIQQELKRLQEETKEAVESRK